nr:G protein-coupled receptor [Proales similis]
MAAQAARLEHVCLVCRCRSIYLIECTADMNWPQEMPVELESDQFSAVDRRLVSLFIDAGFGPLELRVQQSTFDSMFRLKNLHLNRVSGFEKLPRLAALSHLQDLTIQNMGLVAVSAEFCTGKRELFKLDLAYNRLRGFDSFSLDQCEQLSLLDFSHNRIESLGRMFTRDSQLLHLIVDNNLLKEIAANDFIHLRELRRLSLAYNRIERIAERAFDVLVNLREMNLAHNLIRRLPSSSPVYGSIYDLDLSGNDAMLDFPLSTQFGRIRSLRTHFSYHCCSFLKSFEESQSMVALNEHIFQVREQRPNLSEIDESFLQLLDVDTVLVAEAGPLAETSEPCGSDPYLCGVRFSCSPMPDALTPCENLLDDWWMRIAAWLISLCGVLANLLVIAFNAGKVLTRQGAALQSELIVSAFLIANLALADWLMSVYILFIAVKDATSRHDFVAGALNWQHSFTCHLAGFLAIVSSVSSALTLLFITYERYRALKLPARRMTLTEALLASTLIWLCSVCVASLPLADLNRYSSYAICLPFDTNQPLDRLYVVSLNGLLITCFVLIFVLYAFIFMNKVSIELDARRDSCSNRSQIELRHSEDQRLACNISLLVMANSVCWGPVVIICVYSLVAQKSISRAMLKMLAIFVIPFNSLINPFLYSLNTASFRFFIRSILPRR